jgi:CRISPR-associated exonuclease Cas4
MYNDEELLMLSGIQHVTFCERQWALIHIEQKWIENQRTVEGHHLHERVDDPFERDSRGDVITLRSISVVSYSLGLYGVADLVELQKTEEDAGYRFPNHPGCWKLYPIEYKRGKPKSDERDEVQLCAQAMCLEEMYGYQINKGAFFYGETRHRLELLFTEELRNKVRYLAERMHYLFSNGITPNAEYKSSCHSCSLFNLCLPKEVRFDNSVNLYLNSMFNNEA